MLYLLPLNLIGAKEQNQSERIYKILFKYFPKVLK